MESLSGLESALIETVVYADVFDYPLTRGEIHRYLHGMVASPQFVNLNLKRVRHDLGLLEEHSDYYVLPGRSDIIEKRQRRAACAEQMWPNVGRYGRLLADIPFVRMVALTGSLAVANVGEEADLDFLIVAETGRLWVCRAMVIGVVKLAAQRGVILCPNFIISERSMYFRERNIYTAHELAQMIPLTGMQVYGRMREANKWTELYLPNADGPPKISPVVSHRSTGLRKLGESILRLPPGTWFDQWEMSRKIKKFRGQNNSLAEVRFSKDWCQGHFEGHGQRTIDAFTQRLRRLENVSTIKT